LLSIPADSDFIITGTFDSDSIIVDTGILFYYYYFIITTTTLGDRTHGLVVVLVFLVACCAFSTLGDI
jgi:hypothetical protein